MRPLNDVRGVIPDCSAMTIERCARWFISANAGFRMLRMPGTEFNVRGTVVRVRIGSTMAFNHARVPMSCRDGPGSGIQLRSFVGRFAEQVRRVTDQARRTASSRSMPPGRRDAS
jgi:hypothetical protein